MNMFLARSSATNIIFLLQHMKSYILFSGPYIFVEKHYLLIVILVVSIIYTILYILKRPTVHFIPNFELTEQI